MTFREILSRNLQFFRKRVGLSRRELSRRCGLDDSYVGKLEQGEMNPSLDVLSRLAAELDCSSPRLVQRELPEDKPNQPPDTEADGGEPLLDKLIRNINRPIAIISREGLLLEANQAFYEYREFVEDEPVGTRFWELSMWDVFGEGRRELKETMMKALEKHISMFVRVVSEQVDTRHSFYLLFGKIDNQNYVGDYAIVEILDPGPHPPHRIAVNRLEMIAEW